MHIYFTLFFFVNNIGENVLVIGGGPSGNDIVTQLYQVVNQITQCVSSNTPKESLMKLIIGKLITIISYNLKKMYILNLFY